MTSASAVSAYLRRAGFTPVPRHSREGVSVSGSKVTRSVHVSVTIDLPRKEARFAAEVDETLAASPYVVERTSDTTWRIDA